ncbi:MAG: hypothetical protein BGO50_18120 [Rhodanobacter sp. 67-28]|nr:MAG: hypothetical protein ABS98_14610 [Xanthomonadaceae bacterium SCN 69-48]OJW29820.1 MAG: hypothetical protein BGO50_18120 [Rhodanobacter sp. 67-28]
MGPLYGPLYGMMTVRAAEPDNTQAHDAGHAKQSASHASNHTPAESNGEAHGVAHGGAKNVSHVMLSGMTVLSMALFALGIGVAALFGGFS